MLKTLYNSALNNDENKKISAVVLKMEGMKGYENRDAPPKFIPKLCHIKTFKFIHLFKVK